MDAIEVIKESGMRITESRTSVLEAMLRFNNALSQPELEKLLVGKLDRVTIYRVLDAFLEHGLIHKVPDDSGVVRFAICRHEHAEGAHGHQHLEDHLHFKCDSCGKTTCVELAQAPELHVPKEYQINQWQILAHGTCPLCKV